VVKVTLEKTFGGTLTANGKKAPATFTVPKGTIIHVTAKADPGFYVGKIVVDGSVYAPRGMVTGFAIGLQPMRDVVISAYFVSPAPGTPITPAKPPSAPGAAPRGKAPKAVLPSLVSLLIAVAVMGMLVLFKI